VNQRGWRRCLFLLSGEHPSLPAAELLASLEAEGYTYRVVEERTQILILEVDPEGAAAATRRSALTNYCMQLLLDVPVEEELILKAVGEANFGPWIGGEVSFAVRIRRIRRESLPLDVLRMERKIGACILRSLGANMRVDLSSPDLLFRGVVSGERFFFGVQLASRDRKGFNQRRSPLRPFFVPSALHPKTARVMVNLSRAAPGALLLDPFCGTGGIIMEASLVGCLPVGLDIDGRILRGCLLNLDHYGVRAFTVHGDARELPIRTCMVDAVATDPPYGRASSTKGISVPELLESSLAMAAEVLRSGGYLCFAVPVEYYHDDLVDAKDFSQVEKHTMRVHRSLSRRIVVLCRR